MTFSTFSGAAVVGAEGEDVVVVVQWDLTFGMSLTLVSLAR